ncbi:hypothetical protein ASPNIDRAFT_44636 [Aspergillus niger ATCC 1015]|uniref:Uncharacterized protein n=1 Tax=Aspergillus niger (strain ATCC 1015 / CBS 113.46 / FGSC A1144 / LSHB Ac4 / NCTC 3858a / NRRL 328 / USDA 3528.7) TaxID=380704 RepID=G3Y7W9_ASPNA|nr:uncharacterized protein BO96DRAFT_439706 [Aspergillus niger CBS 101883]EHA21413.1 hypothetical protein ASPNIDRAFT_44636 [Aspergillus niger ATCC 1015]PYH50651.1 hypothetical protein BO96DRAFT_439706 [Aspergillus niger CBS 101883]
MIEIALDPRNRTGGIESPIRAYHGLSEQLYLGLYSLKEPRTTPTIQHQPERNVQARPPSIILARFQTRGVHREAKPSDASVFPALPRVSFPYVFASSRFHAYCALPQDSLERESAVTEAIYLFCESADGICNEAFSLTCLKAPGARAPAWPWYAYRALS